MTTYELIQKLARYPASTKVTIAVDWSEPIIDDSYQQIEGDPTITLKPSGWATEPTEDDGKYPGEDGCAAEPASTSLSPHELARKVLVKLDDAVESGSENAAANLVHIYRQLTT